MAVTVKLARVVMLAPVMAVLAAAQGMDRAGLSEGTAGNLSARTAEDHVVLTPTAMGYATMTVDDLVVTTLDGEPVEGEPTAIIDGDPEKTLKQAVVDLTGIDLDGEAHRYFTTAKRFEMLLGGATEQALAIGKVLATEPV